MRFLICCALASNVCASSCAGPDSDANGDSATMLLHSNAKVHFEGDESHKTTHAAVTELRRHAHTNARAKSVIDGTADQEVGIAGQAGRGVQEGAQSSKRRSEFKIHASTQFVIPPSDLEDLWNVCDLDGDGKLTVPEFSDCLTKSKLSRDGRDGRDHTASLFCRHKRGSRQARKCSKQTRSKKELKKAINFEEFEEWAGTLSATQVGYFKTPRTIRTRKEFETCDQNGDNSLDVEEWEDCARSLHFNEQMIIFKKLDMNGYGTIDFEEFKKQLR